MDALHCLCLVSVLPESYLPNNWMRDCSLTPSQQLFGYFTARTNYISMRWFWRCLLCTRPTLLVRFYYVSLLKQQSVCRHFYHTLSYFASPSVFVLLNVEKRESTGLSSKTQSTVLVSSTETITPPIWSPKTGKWLCVLFFNHDRTPLLLI
jgi:hypothetical protein